MTLPTKYQWILSSRVTPSPRPCKTNLQAGLITDPSQALVTPEAVSETHLLPASLNKLDKYGYLAFCLSISVNQQRNHTK